MNEPVIKSNFDVSKLNREEIRNLIQKIGKLSLILPGTLVGDSPEYLAVCPLKHTFAGGMYIREIFLPKNMLFVTKIHKKEHPFFLQKGKVSVLTEDGIVHFKAPYNGVTKAGTQRLIITHEDTVWITVHVTKETDLAKIEDEVIAKTFDEVDFSY